MSLTLLVEDDEQLAALYSLNIHAYAGSDVVWKRTVEEAIQVFQVIPQINLLVCGEGTDASSGAKLLIQFLDTSGIEIPVIVIGGKPENHKHATVLPKASEFRIVVRAVAQALGVTPEKMLKKIIPDYFPIHTNHFMYIDEVDCDIYARSSDFPKKIYFEKIILKNATISRGLVQGFQDKKIEFLYVLKGNRLKVVNAFSKQMVQRLHDESLPLEQRILSTGDSYQFVAKIFQTGKADKEGIELVQATMMSVMKIAVHSKTDVRNLLENLLRSKTDYLYRHVILTSYLCSHVIRTIHGDEKIANEHMVKLCYASLFHDIYLKSEEEALIVNQSDLQSSSFTADEKKLILTHPYRAALLVKTLVGAPLDVERIIRQHHGSETGQSFPEQLESGISQLSYIFIACEAYANEMLAQSAIGEIIDYNQIVGRLPPQYKGKKLSAIIALLGEKENKGDTDGAMPPS